MGSPPALDQAQQGELKGAVRQPPAAAGIELANWYWKAEHQFIWERFGGSLSRSSCLNYLLNVIWDNAPAHRGEAVREHLRTPELNLRLVNLPGYSPDFNADEAIWGWAREEATGNLCLGSEVKVQERVGSFLAGLAYRKEEVKRRCRTVLQSRADTLLRDSHTDSQHSENAHPTLALV